MPLCRVIVGWGDMSLHGVLWLVGKSMGDLFFAIFQTAWLPGHVGNR
jgi:hypothetical protein